jgi:hypothetical protein
LAETFNFMQFYPCQTLTSPLNFNTFFIVVLGLGFMQIEH